MERPLEHRRKLYTRRRGAGHAAGRRYCVPVVGAARDLELECLDPILRDPYLIPLFG